jgi:hypothetical protein
LRQFAAEIDRLYRDLEGIAELVPMEPYLELKLRGNGRGLITVDGKAQDVSQHSRLFFGLQLDQTDLPAISASLTAADPR